MSTGDASSADAPLRRQPGGPAKGDRRRQAIVDAVEHLLETRTIGALSVEDIAAEAGISRSGFYFYFESKYAALADALSDVADAIERAADDFFGDTGREPRDYVLDALSGVAAMWREHADLMVAVVDAAHSDAGARALWDDWRQRFIDGITASIEEERRARPRRDERRRRGGPRPGAARDEPRHVPRPRPHAGRRRRGRARGGRPGVGVAVGGVGRAPHPVGRRPTSG